MTGDGPGPWIDCPRCGASVGLSRFVESDDEIAAAVAVCPSCSERVHLASAEPGYLAPADDHDSR